MVPGLAPRIREKDMYAVQAVRGNHILDHFNSIVLDNADVVKVHFIEPLS